MAEISVRGVRFHLQLLGGGPPAVVFLHGLVMDNLSSWYFTSATPVARLAPVLLYDLRGHGRSERPPHGYSIADMVLDLQGLLDACRVERPVLLVGNSFGGLLALAFALHAPERVGGLVLVDAHLFDPGWGLEMAATLSLDGEERDRLIAQNFSRWIGRHSARKRTRLAETARALVHGTSLIRDLQSSPPFEVAALANLDAPVTALYGEASDVRPRGEALARKLPRCELSIVPGCTHSLLWEATDVVKAAILEASRRFLLRAPSPTTRTEG